MNGKLRSMTALYCKSVCNKGVERRVRVDGGRP